MNILHINFSFTQGGIDAMMNDIMRQQLNMGHKVSLLIINNQIEENPKSLLPKEVKLYKVGRPVHSNNPLYFAKIIYLVNYKIKPDIIHCHNYKIGYFIKLLHGKSVLTVHAMNENVKYNNRFDTIVAISKSVKDDIKKTYQGSVEVIYNGIDFSKIKRKKDTFSPSRKCNIVLVGRLDHTTKGQDVAINAMKYLDGINIDFHLDIIGSGVSSDYLSSLIKQDNLEDKVKLLGEKKRDWLYLHLCEYDLLILPSRHEGFGLTIVEGIAAGLPILSSNIDGPKEILNNGSYGLLFNSNDVKDLARKILEFVQIPKDELYKKEQLAYNYMYENFSIELTTNRYLLLYVKLLK